MDESKMKIFFGETGLSGHISRYYFLSPIGQVRITGNMEYITRVDFVDGASEQTGEISDLHLQCATQLSEYFSGQRYHFDIPVYLEGSPFFCDVWKELLKIPFGSFISYALLARRIGNPKSVRAVGHANSKNPVSIIVPCHRVVGSQGQLTGYAGGLERKRWLLEHEQRSSNQILDFNFQ